METLSKSFNEHSILWLVLSSLIGGIVGAAIHSVFEEIINPRLRERREIEKVVRRYTIPILRSADSLRGRIFNFLGSLKRNLNYNQDEEYRYSMLYQFGEFLAWVRILELEVHFLDFNDAESARQFRVRLYSVFKGLTSQWYFQSDGAAWAETPTIPRLVLSAIGESIITEGRDGRTVAGYSEFRRKMNEDPACQKWFHVLDEYLSKVTAAEADPRWDRLAIVSAQLSVLMATLDPESKQLKKRPLDLHHLKTSLPKQRLVSELRAAGFGDDLLEIRSESETSAK